jgi:hypothetical protein
MPAGTVASLLRVDRQKRKGKRRRGGSAVQVVVLEEAEDAGQDHGEQGR